MGAWGTGAFENDDAADWLGDFMDQPSESLLTKTLSIVAQFDPEDYLEVTEAGSAIAAAEVVAALHGKPMPGLPDELAAWVASRESGAPSELLSVARRALTRIALNSEFDDNWIDEEDGLKWRASLSELAGRLALHKAK